MSTAATEATAKLARQRTYYPIVTVKMGGEILRRRLNDLKMVMQVRDVVETTSERIRLQWLIEEMAVRL